MRRDPLRRRGLGGGWSGLTVAIAVTVALAVVGTLAGGLVRGGHGRRGTPRVGMVEQSGRVSRSAKRHG